MVGVNTKIWIIGLLYLICVGCEETFIPSEVSNSRQFLVVEGTLTNELKRQSIKLSTSVENFGDIPEPYAGAIVTISDGFDVFVLEEQENGIYLTDSMSAVFPRNYRLEVRTNDEIYTAEATSALGPPLVQPVLSEVSPGIFEYDYIGSERPSMLELLVDWQDTDSTGTLRNNEVRLFYYTLNNLEVNEIFAPEKEDLLFPEGARMFRRQYSLTEEHQRFIRSFLSETEWRGGFFDVAPGNVVTNLSDGAVGYFAVSMVETDETIVR